MALYPGNSKESLSQIALGIPCSQPRSQALSQRNPYILQPNTAHLQLIYAVPCMAELSQSK